MKLFHTTQKLSCILLGMGMMASAHATHVSCGDEFSTDLEVVTLDENVGPCASTNAVLISGDNVQFMLDGFSISSSTGDNRGIRIEGNENQVMGPGTVTGFRRNIDIHGGNDNSVSKLDLTGGRHGVRIFAPDFDAATGNHISDNVISNMNRSGILLRTNSFGDVSGNHIHDNDIQDIDATGSFSRGIFLDIMDDGFGDSNEIQRNNIQNIVSETSAEGIFIVSASPGSSSANNNLVENNTIDSVSNNGVAGISADGISIQSDILSTASFNQIDLNRIEDTDRYGIVIDAGGIISSDRNTVFLNRIRRPGAEAIALGPVGAGSVLLNSVTWNFAQDPQGLQTYCDSSGVFNNWGINFDGLSSLFGPPGPC